MICTRHQIIRR